MISKKHPKDRPVPASELDIRADAGLPPRKTTLEQKFRRELALTLRRARNLAELTQTELAEKLGASSWQSNLSRLESPTAKHAPNLFSVARILDVCGWRLRAVPIDSADSDVWIDLQEIGDEGDQERDQRIDLENGVPTAGGRAQAHPPPQSRPVFRPLHDRVLVRAFEPEDRTHGGVLLPDGARKRPEVGEIVAVGEGMLSEHGELTSLDVQVGDRILYGKWSGTEVKIDGDSLLIMKESDILGIVDSSEDEELGEKEVA